MFEVEIILDLKDCLFSKVIFESLLPESLNPPSNRVKVLLEHNPPKILLHISSSNPSLLRAALNSFLRLIILLEDLFKNFHSNV